MYLLVFQAFLKDTHLQIITGKVYITSRGRLVYSKVRGISRTACPLLLVPVCAYAFSLRRRCLQYGRCPPNTQVPRAATD